MAGPAVFFVPLAIAGGKVFFKFASKKAAQAFKSKFAKAGNVTSKQPPKSATVTTTGSNKGKQIVSDMTSPKTNPSVRSRNPNTKTLPKKPSNKSGAGTAIAAGTTAVGVGASATSTSKSADKTPSKPTSRPTSKAAKDAAAAKRRITRVEAREKKLQADSRRAKQTAADKIAARDANMNTKKSIPAAKTWKDYSSIAAAKRAGSIYYSKNGKKQAAVTQADLDKSGLSLRDYVNYKTGKTRKKDKK